MTRDEIGMTGGWVHHYVSTYCLHELNDGDPEQHARCRNTCKACDRPCECPTHTEDEIASAPESWVDQARDMARELLAAIEVFDRRQVITPELWQRIHTAPDLFWLRGEEQPRGQWAPPEVPHA